jgi:hypothetical protein
MLSAAYRPRSLSHSLDPDLDFGHSDLSAWLGALKVRYSSEEETPSAGGSLLSQSGVALSSWRVKNHLFVRFDVRSQSRLFLNLDMTG